MDETNYQKKYYREKRQLLSLKRKIRYRQNAEYRETVKERAKARYAEIKAAQPKYIRGSELAEILNVVPASIYFWARGGLFPQIEYSEKGHPLFTPWQVERIQSVFEKVREANPNTKFYKHVLLDIRRQLELNWEEPNGKATGAKTRGNNHRNKN